MLTALRTTLRPWRTPLTLVLAGTALRLIYLAWFCPYSLVEDEAYYRLWARHLDWSYLTKGPGIALTIALGTLVAGDTELGVRLAAPLCGAVLALGVAGLAGELVRKAPGDPGRRARARAWGAASALLSPPLQAAALLMTIDAPMLACWAVATWAAARALARPTPLPWIALGTAVGVGALFKLTILVLVPVVAVMVASRPRGSVRWRWPVAAFAIALLGLAPQIFWNATHGWAAAGHLGEHLSSPTTPGIMTRLGWVGEYATLQVLLGGPILLAAILGAIASRHAREPLSTPHGWRVATWCALAPSLLYLGVALFTRVEGNWALGGLIPCLGMAGAWLAESQQTARHVSRAIIAIGLTTGLAMTRLDWIARLPIVGPAVPLGRLTAGPQLAGGVRDFMSDLEHRSGMEPIVISEHYGRAALLEFYLNAGSVEPVHVLCASFALGGRVTQYDLWSDHRLDDPALAGRPAVLLGGRPQDWSLFAERIEELDPIRGDHKARRAFIGWAYRPPPSPRTNAQESPIP